MDCDSMCVTCYSGDINIAFPGNYMLKKQALVN